jgi:hypothetical protein
MFIKRDLVKRIMSQSGKTKEEVINLIQEAKNRKEATKSWADYESDEPFDTSDFPEFFKKRKQNIPPNINTNIPRIDNPILNNKDDLYHILIKYLEQYHQEYTKGENLDNILQHTLSYLQEVNNNTPLPLPFKKTIQRFIFQFKPTQFTTKNIPFDIDFKIPDIYQPPQQLSEELLQTHIKEIIKEYKDMLNILTPKHVIKLLEGILHTNLDKYKTFIKQTIKNNLPKTPIQEKYLPKIQQINIDELFGTPSPQEEEINIESPKTKSPKSKKSKSTKAKSTKSKRKSVKKTKSKRKSVKKTKSKRKSVKKSKSKRKSVKKSKSKQKSVKKSKSKRKSVKKSKSKRKSVKKSKSKRKSVKKSKSNRKSIKKAKSVKKTKSVKKSKSVKKTKSVKKSKSVKKTKSVKKSKSKRKSVKKAKSVKKTKSKRKSTKKAKSVKRTSNSKK